MASRFQSSSGASPARVVYVIASMITGGTQTHLLQVFRFLDRSRFEPHLYCLREGGDLIEAVRGLAVPVTTFGMKGTLKSPGDAAALARMVRSLRRLRPQLVHGYLLRGNFFAAVAARAAGVPVVVTSKRGLHRPAGISERIAVDVSNRLSTVITGNSPAVLEFTEEVENTHGTPLEMIPSGIDTERFSRAAATSIRAELGLEGVPTVGTAITFRPRKGYELLFRAFARVRSRLPAARLVVAGAERFSEAADALVDELGIRNAVSLLGVRSDMPHVLASLDVFVLPSESEGMSNAVLEAMSMGLPVVATAVGGNPVVIDEGNCGYLVAYGDHDAMAQRITRLLEQPDLAAALGRAARTRVEERYSARSMVAQMERLYDRLLAGSLETAKEP